jgi:hypothetical protein
MLYLLNPRLWIALAIAGALTFSHIWVYRHGKAIQRTESVAEALQALADARAVEQKRQAVADAANRAAATRESRIRTALRDARTERDGMRGDLNAANDYAKESRAAAERAASLSTDLLGRCTARYLDVAESAARADSEARQLRQAWPK